eukprot:1945179-Amphidinium_carterae.1
MAKRQRTTTRTMLTTRMTSPNFCSTFDNFFDYFYHFYDFERIGEEDHYKEHYTFSNVMNKISQT